MTARLADTKEGIARAAALLKGGALVAFGTETVYGLGADATNAQAVAAIFAGGVSSSPERSWWPSITAPSAPLLV